MYTPTGKSPTGTSNTSACIVDESSRLWTGPGINTEICECFSETDTCTCTSHALSLAAGHGDAHTQQDQGHTVVELLCSGTVTTGMENSLKTENCSVILTEQRRRIALVSNYSCTLRGKEKERFLKTRG